MVLDEHRNGVVFADSGEIKGANAQLLLILAASHRQAVHNERAPENFPFISATQLSPSELGDDEASLRRRVYRCRNKSQMASKAGDLAQATRP